MKRLRGVALAGFGLLLGLGSVPAWADGSSYDPTTLFTSVNLTNFASSVGTLGASILIIVLALKAISVVKAGINKL